jgi:pimeloyl-ACP methyl ester carboxylesterase
MTVALNITEAGSGLPVVLLHAFPLSSQMFVEQRTVLGKQCRVITPDQRGFGGSPLRGDPASLGRPSLDICADDLMRVLDRLGVEKAVVGGVSMGGYVAMAFLRRHPERVRALILADTKASADTESAAANRLRIADAVEAARSSEPLFDEVMPKLLGETTVAKRPEVVDTVRAAIRQAQPAAVAWAQRAMATRRDSAELLRTANVPALVLVGEEDQLTTRDDAEALAGAMPEARLVTLPEAGHLSPIEDPVAFNAAVGDFLSDLD